MLGLIKRKKHQLLEDEPDRKPMPKFTRQELQAARERNRQRKKRGTDSEYMANLFEEHRSLGILRRRASECRSTLK